jgi:maleate isomerase
MKLDFETDGGSASRARLGVIVLETDETLEPEFAKILQISGVATYHSRIPMVTEIRPDTLARMESDLPASARLFPSAAPFDVFGYGCTSAATVIGPAAVQAAVQSVHPGVPVTNPLSALIAGCHALNARKIGFITPYLPEVSAMMRQKLEDAGMEITGFGSFEESDDRQVARISEASISQAIDTIAATSDCDAIVISCTNLRCLDIIQDAEARTGVAILSSNQALAWHMLQLAGVEAQRDDLGALFKLPLVAQQPIG